MRGIKDTGGERRECLLDGGGEEVVRSRRERKRERLSKDGGKEVNRYDLGRKGRSDIVGGEEWYYL